MVNQGAGSSQQQQQTHSTFASAGVRMSGSVRGPTPNSSLLRPTASLDRPVSSLASPLVPGVTQPRLAVPDVASLVIQGAAGASTVHTLSNSGTLSIPETPEIARLRAQLDAEDQLIAQQQQQEFLNLQQPQMSPQQAETLLRQQREQARQQQLLAHQQRCQPFRPAVPSPLAQTHANPSHPVPIPATSHTTFNFGNGSYNPGAPGQFSPVSQLNPTQSPQYGSLGNLPTGNPAPASQLNPAQVPHHGSLGSLTTGNPAITTQPASPLAGMDHAQILAMIDQRV